MGLDYDYRIYIKRENLKSTLKYVFNKCEKNRSGSDFQQDKLMKVNRFPNRIERTEIKNYGLNQGLDCNLIFENDEKIWEYHLNDLCESYQPNTDDEGDFIGFYQVDENNFWVGNIEIRINDYHEKISACSAQPIKKFPKKR